MSRALNVIIEFKCQDEWKTFNPVVDGKSFGYTYFQGCIRDFFSEEVPVLGYPKTMSEETKQILGGDFDYCGSQTFVYAKDLFTLIDKKREYYKARLQKAQKNSSICHKLDDIMSELMKNENKDLKELQKLTIEMQEVFDANDNQDDIDYYEETIENLNYIKETFNALSEMVSIVYDLYGEPEVRFITNIG
jgi:hypothetical protein